MKKKRAYKRYSINQKLDHSKKMIDKRWDCTHNENDPKFNYFLGYNNKVNGIYDSDKQDNKCYRAGLKRAVKDLRKAFSRKL